MLHDPMAMSCGTVGRASGVGIASRLLTVGMFPGIYMSENGFVAAGESWNGMLKGVGGYCGRVKVEVPRWGLSKPATEIWGIGRIRF